MCCIRAQNSHNNFEILFNSHFTPRTRFKTLCYRAIELLQKIQYNLPGVMTVKPMEVAPWLIPPLNVVLDLLQYDKHSTPPCIILQIFLELINSHTNSLIIYTDGSKTDTGTGAAVFSSGSSHSWSMPNDTSVYTTEAYAFWQALQICNLNLEHRHFTICSDSSNSVLLAISNSFTSGPLVQMSLALIKHICDQGKTLRFIWLPSHVGRHGNEMADEAARIATQSNIVDVQILKHTDVKCCIRRKLLAS